jgi:hypothetical protein
MSTRSDPWDDIETLLDLLRVDEEVLCAILEALGELEDSDDYDFAWNESSIEDFLLDEHPGGRPSYGCPP